MFMITPGGVMIMRVPVGMRVIVGARHVLLAVRCCDHGECL